MTEVKLTVEDLDKIERFHKEIGPKNGFATILYNEVTALIAAAREAIVAREVLEQYRTDVLSALATVNTIDALGGDYPTRTEASLKQRDLEQRLRIINAALSPPPSTVEGDRKEGDADSDDSARRSDGESSGNIAQPSQEKLPYPYDILGDQRDSIQVGLDGVKRVRFGEEEPVAAPPPEDQPDKIAKLCARLESHEGYECPYDLLAEAATALQQQSGLIKFKKDEISATNDVCRELIAERDEAQAEIARLREALEEIANSRKGPHYAVEPTCQNIARKALGGKE